jgi:hypothetical protein
MWTKMFRIKDHIYFLDDVKRFYINGTEINIVFKDDTICKFTVDEKDKHDWIELKDNWLKFFCN